MSTTTLRSKPPSGTRDLLPREVAIRDWATGVIRSTYESFGYQRIETPALENIELLKRGEGGENLQLIFEILKRGDKLQKAINGALPDLARKEDSPAADYDDRRHVDYDVAQAGDAAVRSLAGKLSDMGLRFDLTVPLVRYYANNQNDLPTPFKAIQIGPVWRAERPQQGRFRQFTQCDIDVIGTKAPFAELDLIMATATTLKALGFQDFTVRINDRRILQGLAAHCRFEQSRTENVFIAIDKLDKIGLEGVQKELQANGHQRDSIEQLIALFRPVLEALESQTDNGIETSRKLRESLPELPESDSVDTLIELIEAVAANCDACPRIVFDPTLVRGMGYYTGPIFEVSVPGYSSSVAGGGRYDRMIGKFLGREVEACGFSIGFERIVSILLERDFQPPSEEPPMAFIYDPRRDSLAGVSEAVSKLRENNKNLSMTAKRKDLTKQLDNLAEQGFGSFCIFRGDPSDLQVKELSK